MPLPSLITLFIAIRPYSYVRHARDSPLAVMDLLFISLEWWRGTLVSMAVHSLLKSDALWSIMICFSGDSPNTPCRLFFACPNQPWGSQSAITRESEARVRVRKTPPPSICNICSLSFLATLWLFILLFFATSCLLFLHDKDPSRRGGKGTKSLPFLRLECGKHTHPPHSAGSDV